jgi:hypothetical protein
MPVWSLRPSIEGSEENLGFTVLCSVRIDLWSYDILTRTLEAGVVKLCAKLPFVELREQHYRKSLLVGWSICVEVLLLKTSVHDFLLPMLIRGDYVQI